MKSPDEQHQLSRRFRLKPSKKLEEQKEKVFTAIRMGIYAYERGYGAVEETRPTQIPRTAPYRDAAFIGITSTVSARYYPTGTLYLKVFCRDRKDCKTALEKIEESLSHLL